MSETFSSALMITVAGTGLVFGIILLIWFLIWALVRLTTPRASPEPLPWAKDTETLHDQRRRAAGAAVATAFALNQQAHDDRPHVPPLPPTAIISAWQVVMRQNQLRRRHPR